MAICPKRLKSVAAHELPSAKLKALRSVRNLRPENVSHHIRFAAAGRTRASPAKELERDERLGAVIPADGELGAHGLDVGGEEAIVHRGYWFIRTFVCRMRNGEE
jgi:2-oxoglutarate dehydrogenase complex dehydrogenase (E1) component-like enzyme